MLLQQLACYRPPAGPPTSPARPYSRQQTVRWELDLDHDGKVVDIVDLADASQHATKAGRPMIVPNVSRTVGIAPCPGVDDIQYVLGWVDDKTKPSRVAATHAAFVDLAQRWAREDPHEPAAQALVAFYRRGGLRQPLPSMDRWTSKDRMVVVVDGKRVTDCPSLWTLWSTVVEERKSGTAGGAAGRRGLCLVCGQVGTLLDRMPQALPKALVPRADQEIALVSVNKRIHSFDFTEGLTNAPICTTCGQAAVTHLTTILSDDRHTFTYPRQRSRVAWWVTDGADSDTIALLDEHPRVIADYLARLATGRKPRVLDPHTFCSVTLSGNVSRLVVHDWIEMPLPEVEANVQRWFTDHLIVPRWQPKPAGFPLWLLVACTGQWQPRNGPTGRYIRLADKAADRPDNLAPLLLRSALHHDPLPPHLGAHIVRRIRTDQHLDAPRAALLRLTLLRHHTATGQGPNAVLDETQTEPAYLYGRLFAVLESLQYRAFGKDRLPGTTFFHRYFAGAVANPRIALTQGLQFYPAWIKKLDSTARDTSTEPARKIAAQRAARAATRYKARIRELENALAQPPRPLNTTTDQSWFILGYFHQQAHDINAARAGRAHEIPVDQLTASDTTGQSIDQTDTTDQTEGTNPDAS